MVSQADARAAAGAVADPEIPVLSIADLGILRAVTVNEDNSADVVITPTYMGCPAMDAIAADVRGALARIGAAEVRVHIVLSPAWSTDWMSAAGREKLRAYGIAPPPARAGGAPECPLCGSARVEMIAAFGSTACKSLWRCLSCREPFDQFKCH